MAEGLVTAAQEMPATPPAAGLVSEATAPENGMEAVSTEEQQQYTQAMQMVSEIVHANDESSQGIINSLSQGTPVEAVTNAADLVLTKVEEAFGGELGETLILPLVDEVSDALIELGEESGAFDLSDEEIIQVKNSVIQSTLDQYGVTDADVQAKTSELSAMVQQ